MILYCIPDQKKKMPQKTFEGQFVKLNTGDISDNGMRSILDNSSVFVLNSFSMMIAWMSLFLGVFRGEML